MIVLSDAKLAKISHTARWKKTLTCISSYNPFPQPTKTNGRKVQNPIFHT